jgi:hypothetical protein
MACQRYSDKKSFVCCVRSEQVAQFSAVHISAYDLLLNYENIR